MYNYSLYIYIYIKYRFSLLLMSFLLQEIRFIKLKIITEHIIYLTVY